MKPKKTQENQGKPKKTAENQRKPWKNKGKPKKTINKTKKIIETLGSTAAGRDRAPGGRAWAHLRWARFACSRPFLPLHVRPLVLI